MAINAPAFEIYELSGSLRTIRLTGRGLPYPPFTLRTNQRLELTWLPGSAEATATVLGPSEDSTTINGMWKEKYLMSPFEDLAPVTLDREGVYTVAEATDLIDELVMFGGAVQVSWGAITRRGFLSSFEKQWINPNDVAWTMEFKWINRGEAFGPLVTITDQQIGDSFSQVASKLEQYGKIATDFPKNGDLLRGIQNLQQGIEDAMFKAQSAMSNLTRQVTAPIFAARGLLATVRGIKEQASSMFEQAQSELGGAFNGTQEAENRVGAGMSVAVFTPPISSMPYEDRLTGEKYRRDLCRYSRELFHLTAAQEAELAEQVRPETIALYKVHAGESLRDVSQKFYNTPHEWKRIMLYNYLTTVELTAGQPLLIPKINPGADSNGGF